MKVKIFSILYFISGLAFILTQENQGMISDIILKSLIMPLLMVSLIIHIRTLKLLSHRLMLLALICSWAGDIALEFTEIKENMFIAGLICFLFAHILYIITFCLTSGKGLPAKKLIVFIAPVYIAGTGLVYFLYNDLGTLKIPVIVYTLVILTMVAAAISRRQKVNDTSYYLVLLGATLFLISDSLIAINKFSFPFAAASTLIMLTYITGQYLIVAGYTRQIATIQP